jgi:predicted nucleic acid-binding protein
MTVIADSTLLISPAAIGNFGLLEVLYGQLIIPTAVYAEVVTQGAARSALPKPPAPNGSTVAPFRIVASSSISRPGWTAGKRKSLLSPKNFTPISSSWTNQRTTRAREKGYRVRGTVGVLMLAKQRGQIAALTPELDQLRTHGFHLSERVYKACLSSAGE